MVQLSTLACATCPSRRVPCLNTLCLVCIHVDDFTELQMCQMCRRTVSHMAYYMYIPRCLLEHNVCNYLHLNLVLSDLTQYKPPRFFGSSRLYKDFDMVNSSWIGYCMACTHKRFLELRELFERICVPSNF